MYCLLQKCDDLKAGVTNNFEELQKTLGFIMKRIINTSPVDANGFAMPSPSNFTPSVMLSSSSTPSVVSSSVWGSIAKI